VSEEKKKRKRCVGIWENIFVFFFFLEIWGQRQWERINFNYFILFIIIIIFEEKERKMGMDVM
jgi:hypothetical protein